MPKLTLIGLYFWICLAQKVVSGEDVKVGGELVLKPDKSTVTGNITSIIWKHGKDKLAEWDKDFGGLDIYAAFKERTTLNQTTGELRISGLKKTDSGVYSVEINSKLLDKTYKLSVIKAVPKPTITSSCNANKTSCTLTCEGDTTDAEPVTYSWKVGGRAWEVGGKQLIVSKSDTGKSTNGYKYVCKMNNSVSEEGEVSEPVGEVFGPEAVPKPTITSSCKPDKTSCTLTCEGDTTDAEPVTYSWKVGGRAWEVGGKQLIVSKSDTGKSTNGYKYVCKLKNSVSGEVSEPVGEVFGPELINIDAIVGVVIVVLVAIVITGLMWKKNTGYPQDTWIDFLRKYCGGMCGGDEKTKTDGSAAAVGEDESKMNGSSAPVGEDETKTDGSAAAVGEDESKMNGSSAPVGEDETKTDGSAAPVGEDESKTDGRAAPVGEDETKTDDSAAPVGENESKMNGSSAPGGEDETKTDGRAAPVGEDETKTDDSAAPVGDLNAAEKGEANGEGSVLLNEDMVKYHNDNGEGREEENSVL